MVWSVKKAERGGRKAARQSCGARWVTRRKKTKRVRAEWGVGRDCVRLVRESGGASMCSIVFVWVARSDPGVSS